MNNFNYTKALVTDIARTQALYPCTELSYTQENRMLRKIMLSNRRMRFKSPDNMLISDMARETLSDRMSLQLQERMVKLLLVPFDVLCTAIYRNHIEDSDKYPFQVPNRFMENVFRLGRIPVRDFAEYARQNRLLPTADRLRMLQDEYWLGEEDNLMFLFLLLKQYIFHTGEEILIDYFECGTDRENLQVVIDVFLRPLAEAQGTL